MSRFSDLVVVAVLSSGITYGLANYSHIFSHNRLTPTELFNLRSKCSALAEKFVEGETGGDIVGQESPYYDATNNRCLVNRFLHMHGGYSEGGGTMHFLNDAQTGAVLARTQASPHNKLGWITNSKTGQQEEAPYETAETFIHEQTTQNEDAK